MTEDRRLVCDVFYLSIKVVDKENQEISDVSVSIKASSADIAESAYTAKSGIAEFRLPIENYEVTARLQTNHLMKKIDETKTTIIDLDKQSETITIKFSDYPPSFLNTPAFTAVTLPILILILIIFFIWFFIIRKHRMRGKPGEPGKVEGDVTIPEVSRYKPLRVREPVGPPDEEGTDAMDEEIADEMPTADEEPQEKPMEKEEQTEENP
jgi:hypothetical protein